MKDSDFADGIYQILSAIDYVKGGGYDISTGIDYKNDVFETHSFWAHADDDWEEGEDYPGFLHYASGLRVDWYKRVGRSTESSKAMKSLDWFKIVVECLESIRDGR